MRALASAVLLALVALAPARAEADERPKRKHACLRALDDLGVKYTRARRRGIRLGVRVRGPIGGVTYTGYRKAPLILDCSLVYSLALSARFLREHGIERATYSSAYQRRRVRGTKRPSKHSYGLAIDVHTYAGDGREFHVRDHYEQGLGDDVDCIGRPLTEGGRVLRTVECQMRRSELFYSLLTPDYDAHHYNHFHIEVRPWKERKDTSAHRQRAAALRRSRK